jgi:TolB-like protein/tetratricopeptide (TPR) repeat protein
MMASPSIAVLPLKTADNGGGESGVHDGGLTDEIATELVRVPRGFPLLIRSAAAFKGKVVDPKTAGRELGVRYVAVGVMRREDRTARINVQLIETESGRQVWADLFDYALDEPGSQQRVAARIARLATNGLLRTESKRPLPPEPKADHYAILGRAAMSGRLNATTNREAMLLFDRGKGLDADSVAVLQGYARTRLLAVLNRWAPRDQRELWLDQAEAAIGRIIHHRPRSYGGFRLRGTLFRARHDPEQAIKAFERALELNSSYSHVYAELGRARLEMGLANVTIEGVKKAISISPTDPDVHEWCLWAGEAEVHQENYGEALHWLQKAHGADPDYDRAVLWLAIAEAGLGRREKGRSLMAKYRARDPDFTISTWSEDYPRSHPVVAAQRERIAQVLRVLGVAEGDLRTGSMR